MKKCLTIEDGVKSALQLYEIKDEISWKYIPRPSGEYTDFVEINGVKYPLFLVAQGPADRSDYRIRAV